jgi:hypothetical protein
MKPIPLTPQTRVIARRVIWFESPAQALRGHVSGDECREALDKAPAGIIDPRSWAYWNLKMGRYPAPRMPRRRLKQSSARPGHSRSSNTG